DAPTSFDAARDIVTAEAAKAVTPAGGGVSDREEAPNMISTAQSPQQLHAAIQTYKELLGGQLEGLRQQYEQSTGQTDFDRFLSEDTLQQLEGRGPGGATGGEAMPDLSQLSDEELMRLA